MCGYGSTEGGTVAYAPAESIYGMDRAVGIVTPWIEIETVDSAKVTQDYGQEGEVRLRALGRGFRHVKLSPSEYEIEDDPWFYPGDQGILFRNGLLVISGRVNEIINRGGLKIAPDTIEEDIKKHPMVADAAAVGVLDSLGIEQIWVAVVCPTAELDIKKMFDYCREKMALSVPDRIFQIDAIPRNQLGKVSRVALTEQLKTLERDLALTLR
jgi:acyl-CoA synthetase (AMP-forming)/AMP-acid ligase II